MTTYTRTICFAFLVGLQAVNAAHAAQGQGARGGLRGPVIGYVFDPSVHAIRPINGIPGSSALGQPLGLPFAVGEAAFSPRGDFALVTSASSDQTAYLVR